MSKINRILDQVLNQISLTKKEEQELTEKANRVISKIKPFLKNEKILIGGSLAKKTIIRKDEQDIDIFVIFKDELSTKNLGNILKKAKLNVVKIHGSRDYFQLSQDNLIIEFIPIVEIDRLRSNKNVTDFSPLHVKYLTKKANKSILNEIKLAKAFCKSNELYGAESFIQGFSGYALEILICYYRTFTNFLKKIQTQDFIDIEKQFKNRKEAFREINQSKLLSPLVLIDPTNKYRNICAGLSKDSLERLRKLAKDFLKSPSIDYFSPTVFDENEFFKRSKNLKVFKLEITTDRDNRDVAGTKMKKFFNFIVSSLNNLDQKVIDSKFIYSQGKSSNAYIALKGSEFIEIKGPKKEFSDAVKNFKKSHKNVYFVRGQARSKERFNINQFFNSLELVSQQMDVKFSFKTI